MQKSPSPLSKAVRRLPFQLSNLLIALLAPVLLLGGVQPVTATTAEIEKLVGSGLVGDSYTGYSVAISGDTAIVGAPRDNNSVGAAFIYSNQDGTWVEEAKLVASDADGQEQFGHSVSIEGDIAVVGAWEDDDQESNAGAVFVFAREDGVWSEQAKLFGSEGGNFQHFGISVSISDETILVGADGVDGDGNDWGGAYIFEKSEGVWTEQQLLIPASKDATRRFGKSVSIDGDYAVIGASDLAHVYARIEGIWESQAVLNEEISNQGFGETVAISGDTIMVGPYIYVRDGMEWALHARLNLPAQYGISNGSSVYLEGDTAVIGLPVYQDGQPLGLRTGGVLVFLRNSGFWGFQDLILASDRFDGDEFGVSVALSGNTVLVGAPKEDDLGEDAGAAYLFEFSENISRPIPPTITSQPEDKHAALWEQVVFGVYTTNNYFPVQYQWQTSEDRGASWSSIQGATESAYIINAVTEPMDGLMFRVIVSDFGGSKVSDSAELTVEGISFVPMAPTVHSIEINRGSLATQERTVNISPSIGPPSPIEQRVSEDPEFSNASWQSFVDEFDFELSEGAGWKTIYYQVRGVYGSSDVVSASIFLNAPYLEISQIRSSFDELDDRFADSVALAEDLLFVGVSGGRDEVGSVYVYKRVEGIWFLDTEIIPDDGQENERFGAKVAYSNGTLLVGSPYFNSRQGKIYTFEFQGENWAQTQEIIGPANSHFGHSIAISGDTILAGEPSYSDVHFGVGRIMVYQKLDGVWTEQTPLSPDEGSDNLRFGTSVGIFGTTAVAGAPGASEDEGSGFIFERDGDSWLLIEKLMPDDLDEEAQFGSSVAISDAILAIGAEKDDEERGSVFVYEKDEESWTFETKLLGDPNQSIWSFGITLEVSNNRIAVSSNFNSSNGRVHLFEKLAGTWQKRILLSDGGGSFGHGLSISGDLFAIASEDVNPTSGVSGIIRLIDLTADSSNLQVPVITRQPDDLTLEEGERAYFNFGMLGAFPSDLQWQLSRDGGASWEDIEGETEWELDIRNLNRLSDGFLFRVVVTNEAGTAVSGSAQLSITKTEPGIDYFSINNNAALTGSTFVTLNSVVTGGQPAEYRASESDDLSGVDWAPYATSAPFELSPELGLKTVYIEFRNEEGTLGPISDTIFLDTPPVFPREIIHPSSVVRSDRYGHKVAVHKDIAAIGSYLRRVENVSNSGAVTVIEREGEQWLEKAVLTLSDRLEGERLGWDVAVYGNTIVAGAVHNSDFGRYSGAAYVFERNGDLWFETAKLTSDDLIAHSRFGESVDIYEDTIVVGALESEGPGSAYVFKKEAGDWTQVAKLVASDGEAGDRLGSAIAIYGDTIVVSDATKEVDANNTGSAYVFSRINGSWVEQERLIPLGEEGHGFGQSLDIFDSTIVVGARGYGTEGIVSGAAFVYSFDGTSWVQSSKLLPSNLTNGALFGYGAAISDDKIFIGTRGAIRQGEAYLYIPDGNGWKQVATFLPADFAGRDWFGSSIALSGNTGIVGAGRSGDAGATFIDLSNAGIEAQLPWAAFVDQDADVYETFPAEFSVFPLGTAPFSFQWESSIDNGASWVAIEGATDATYSIESTSLDMDNLRFRAMITNEAGSTASEDYRITVREITPPAITEFYFNSKGDETTTIRQADIRYDFSGGIWQEYRVSESFDFSDTDWQVVPVQPFIELSSGFGEKTVYLQVRNVKGESEVVSATISYMEAVPGSFDPLQKFVPDDNVLGNTFGSSIDISGDTVVIGFEEGDDGSESLPGIAEVYVKQGAMWVKQATLGASDASIRSKFGWDVAIDGDTIVVGAIAASGVQEGTGAVYVFVRESDVWTEQAKLMADDGEPQDSFGYAVEVSGDTVIVGSVFSDEGEQNAGAAYVFRRSGNAWNDEAKLMPSVLKQNGVFGVSISMYEERVVIASGEPTYDPISSASALVFTREGTEWTETAALNTGDGLFIGREYPSVSMFENTVALGSPEFEIEAKNQFGNLQTFRRVGAVYIFTESSGEWTATRRIDPQLPQLEEDLHFGTRVSLEEDLLVVGAPERQYKGDVFVFRRIAGGDWMQLSELKRPDDSSSIDFGRSVSLSSGYIVTTDPLDNNPRGSAYIYDVSPHLVAEPPVLEPVQNMEATELVQLQFSVSASDPDTADEDLRFSFSGSNFGASLDEITGEFSWTPSENQGPAIYYFTIQVSDGANTDSETFMIKVDATLSSFSEWQQDYLPSGLSEDQLTFEADIDKDNNSSLVEFATGLDPLTADPVHPLEILWNASEERTEFETGLRAGVPGLVIRIEVTENFQDWTTVNLNFDDSAQRWSTSSGEIVLLSALDLGGGIWSLHLQDASGLSTVFARLSIDYSDTP